MLQIKIYCFIGLSLFLAHCGNDSPIKPSSSLLPKIIIVDSDSAISTHRDPVELRQSSLKRDTLTLLVSYSGGCEKHDFALYGLSYFMKSNPVQSNIYLTHDAHGDLCEAYITEKLLFDLTPLKEIYKERHGDYGPIIIHVFMPGSPISVQTFRYDF